MKIQFLQANDSNYQKGRESTIEWIVMHYTGNKNDTAKNNATYFQNNIVETSAHYFVDDNDIFQSVSDNDTAWHCGSKKYLHPYCRNNNSIGIEMCGHYKDGEIYASKKTLSNAAELVSLLCNKYNIPTSHIIRHYDVTGKLCPSYWINNDGLLDFRNSVSNMNKVSIITCVYNGSKYLEETIKSVIVQTYKNFELLIVDDGSTDNTKEIVDKYISKDTRIKYYYQKHKSSSSARNIGIKNANGRYIAILDSDDIWNSDFLEKQLSFMKSKKALCVCSGYEIIDKYSLPINVNVIPHTQIKESDMEVIDYVGNLTGLYDTSKYGKIFFNEELGSIYDDYLFWYEISKLSTIYGNQEILAKYRFSLDSSSSSKFKNIPERYILLTKYMKQSPIIAIKNIIVWGVFGINKYTNISLKKLLNK